MSENDTQALLPYRVGGLLYIPALKDGVADKIIARKYRKLTSIAFCLEDSIRDEALGQAEQALKATLSALASAPEGEESMPLLFARIRSPEHLRHIHQLLGDTESVLTGYILPKFDLSNAAAYASLLPELCQAKRLYYMPILESRMIADSRTRMDCLWKLKELCDGMRDQILNIRVGGADLCNLYGVRRAETQSIYEIGVVRNILEDIINIFAPEYIVSGPVWEYFGTDPRAPWAVGLERETTLDRLNGFIGKTAIHPNQLPLIYRSLQVSRRDYEDARKIAGWDNRELGVAGSNGHDRMNEAKCHIRWACHIAALAQVYGVREEAVPGTNTLYRN